MEPQAALYFAKAIIILSMPASALAIGNLAGKAMEAMGRNPEHAGSIFSKMIIAAAMAEATAIYALVAFFLI